MKSNMASHQNLRANFFCIHDCRKSRLYRLTLSLLTALLLSACGGLAGEPEIVATIPPPTPRPPEAGYPAAPPNLVTGAQIFAENCTRCHGALGDGKGELVLAGQIAVPPANFTDPTTARDQSPLQWFDTITNGRLEKLMPPWGDKLSEQERWAVALYTYTLSYQADQMASGQAVWEANCTECHGATGVGDGPRASELSVAVSNLTQPETLIAQPDQALFDLISQGKGDAMPAFSDKLDETQRWQVISYIRKLSLTNEDAIVQTVPPAPAATEEVEVASAPIPGRISGHITNGTVGGSLVSDLTVKLYVVDNQFNQETHETTVASDGSYAFDDVPIAKDYAYMVTTQYQDRTFGSNMVRGDSTTPALDMPITIYEVTADPAVITISDVAIQMSEVSGVLQVTQIMNFRNTSDRLYSQNETIGGATRFASLSIPLPPDAQILGTGNETQRYTRSDDGKTLIDTQPVYPNEDHVVHITYTMPFDGNANVALPLDYALNGIVQMLVGSDDLKISSSQLAQMSPQTMGGSVFQSYGANLSLPAGSVLSYTVTQSTAASGGVFSTNVLAYVFIGIGSLAIVGAAVLYFYERRSPKPVSDNQALINMLIEQIAELDDMHQKKQINSKAYQEQRKRLKERLAKLMDKK